MTSMNDNKYSGASEAELGFHHRNSPGPLTKLKREPRKIAPIAKAR